MKVRVSPIILPILLAGALVVGIMTFINPPSTSSDEPLADPVSLRHLISKQPLPQPPYDPHAEFHGELATPPRLLASALDGPDMAFAAQVLGFPSQEKHIEVDLTNQRVYAFEGTKKIMDFLVSTGKWGRTPTGTFAIWTKVRSQLMSGGRKDWGTYYYLPNVPFVMFFANADVPKASGYSFHGTYWHSNFGHTMSHGCINMRIEDAEVLYNWADPPVADAKAWSTLATAENPGTKVIIYGEPPTE